jgi:integrase
MYITFDGNRIRKPVSGVHCHEKNWDAKKQRIKKSNKADPFDEVNSFNNRLDYVATRLNLIKQSAFDRRARLTEKFILDRLGDDSLLKSDRYDFFAIVDQYMESIKPVKAPRTMLGKKSVFNFLRDFEKDEQFMISFDIMNQKFFEDLRSYAFDTRKIEDNYFAKIVAVLKTFLNWAFDCDYLKDQVYKKFKATEKETEVICLTLEEFLALHSYEFKSARLQHVRDVFIFGCSTGLRFSDLISLKPSHVNEDFIVKNIQKTKEHIMIPLNKYSREIITRYADSPRSPLPKVSHQKFNKYIKECCEQVGIDTPVTITRFSGGTRKEKTFPKHKLITSHVARKTFTTLSLILGVPERIVKSITGHKKEENFKRYVNYTKEFEKSQVEKVWNVI